MLNGLQNDRVQPRPDPRNVGNLHDWVQPQCLWNHFQWKGTISMKLRLTVQNSSEVLHLPQVLRADLSVRAEGFQHLTSEPSKHTRMLSKHCHRERR